jgi:hypothetical protein
LNLYEQVAEKRKQKRTDDAQDVKIKELKKQIEDIKNQKEQPDDRPKWAMDRRRQDIRVDDLRDSLARGGPAIQTEYDSAYSRFGDRFAKGDGKPAMNVSESDYERANEDKQT